MPTTRRKRRPVKIQFASDLHLEFEHDERGRLQLPVDLDTDVIVLAGDIHCEIAGMDGFVRGLARRAPVVMVAGNHEFYDHEFNGMWEELAAWAATVPDFHLLENRTVELGGVRFVGATFWSGFDGGDPRLMQAAARMMTDYAVIADRDDPRGRLRPARILEEHRRSAAFIEHELRGDDGPRTVVVTHHAPSLQSSRCKGEDWDHLYGSDYEDLMRERSPALWLHGHVHESFEYRVGPTIVACNPRGYPGYGENPGFAAARAIHL